MYDVLFDVLILTLFNILDLIFLSDVNYFCNMTILYTLDVYEINVSQWKRGRGLAKRLQYYIGGVWLKDYNITPPTHLLTREKLRS